MRSLLIFIFICGFTDARCQDSLKNNHYKIRFSIQAQHGFSQFDYENYIDGVEQYKSSSKGYYSDYEGKIISDYTFNPEFKCDFELPLYFKFTCGFNYNTIKFHTKSDRMDYYSYLTYNPSSTPINPVVTGSVSHSEVVGYNMDESQTGNVGTFMGFGFSKQYRKFNFDIDYCFSFHKILTAYTVRNIYDNANSFQKTESFNFMEDYIHTTDARTFGHNVSTNASYSIFKCIHAKVGIQYSRSVFGIRDDTYRHYSTFKNIERLSFVTGLTFSIL